MKIKITYCRCIFLLAGFVLLLVYSCKKDDKPNPTAAANIVTDIDGNVYHTVSIGSQCWMVENLKTTRYRNGDAIPNVTDITAWLALKTGAYCDYENADSNSIINGRLYNYYAVVDSRKLCPAGWHVPVDSEWTCLTNYLGGLSVAGDKLKEAGYTHWGYFNTVATNEAGFTALPGGYRSNTGYFYYLGSEAYWWSSTEEYTNYGWIRVIFYNRSDVYRSPYQKYSGLSVRCIKD